MTPLVVRARELVDIYEPPAPTGASVVLVHGGGFVIGSRRMKPMRFLAARFVEAGLTVCSVDYRLFRPAAATDDVRAALAFWRTRAPDAARITMIGLSAGATLALRAAMHEPVARLACCFGLYELLRMRVPHPAVPTLLLHGDRDRLVPVGQAQRLAAQRAALGLPTRLVVYGGARHGFFRGPSPTADAGVRELVHWSEGRS